MLSVMAIGGIACGVSAALAMCFWNGIVKFFQNSFLPYVRKKLGDKFADAFASVLSFIDDGMVLARRCVKWTVDKVVQGWRWFKTYVLRMRTTYSKTRDGSYTEKRETETVAGVSGNQVVVEVKTETRTLSWSDLPPEFRHEVIKHDASEVTIDDKALIEEKFKKRAKQEQLDLNV